MSKDDIISFTISDITVDHSEFTSADLLRSWSWLVPEQLEPLFITIFGDAFLSDPESGEVFFLDTVDGDLEPIADDLESFTALLTDNREFVSDYFSTIPWLRYKDEILGGDAMPSAMIFNYLTPFALGGEAELDNIALFPIQEHFDMSGEFWEKMQSLESELAQEILATETEETAQAVESTIKSKPFEEPDNSSKH
ncbi:MAG: SMI1/KNR4 family protein [Alcaligenaceae bacterium]|nr:SMI1/KNR4 family protein [Alcaligenaceae bacterium]